MRLRKKDTSHSDSDSQSEPSRKKRRAQKNKKKSSKRKKKACSSSDSSDPDSDSSTTSNSSSASSPPDTSSDESPFPKKKLKKSGTYNPDNWKRLNKRWPMESRPEELLDKSHVNSLTVESLTQLVSFYHETEKIKRKVNVETLSKDRKPKKRKFRSKSDDCKKKLHPARFLRQPIISPTKWWGANVPKRHSETYRSLPLEFTGSDRAISGKIIGQAHDRTAVLRIKHFATSNVSISNKPMKEMRKQDSDGAVVITDFAWETPDTVMKIQEAFFNFMGLLHCLWPYDSTAVSMLRLMNRYRWLGNSDNLQTRIVILNGFFDEVLESNAQRAVNSECILSYREQEEILKNLMLRNGIRPEVPFLQMKNQIQKQNSQNFGSGGTWNSFQTPKNQNRNQKANTSKPTGPNVNGVLVCRYYNENQGRCRNNPSQGNRGCKDKNGREYVHVCSAWSNSNNAWCLKNHKKIEHR